MASGRNITYSVIITVESQQSVGVLVDNTLFPLSPSSDCPILFTGDAPESNEGYKYAKLNNGQVEEEEQFVRAPIHENTPNEFYNRTWNSTNVAKLPSVLPPLPIIDRIESNLHVDNQIPTIHFSANQDELDWMHTDVVNTVKVHADMTYISLNDVKTIKGVEIKLSGRGSRLQLKVSYNVKIPKKDSLSGYRRLKLRGLVIDPSYIREHLTYDFMKSVGLPSTESSFVRVFINNKPSGLYGMIENYKNPWIKNEFGGGKRNDQGILYQGMALGNMLKGPVSYACSDLGYRGADQELYADGTYRIKQEPNIDGPKDYTQLMELTKFLAEAPSTSVDALQLWQKHIDTECFVRSMVAEILLGLIDGYITFVDNYYLYFNPQDQRFVYLPSDVDGSFGCTTVKLSDMWSGNYRTYPGMELNRPLVQKMLEVPELKQRFEHLLVELCEKLFNLDVMNQRIDDLVNMIREDVAWDKSIVRSRPVPKKKESATSNSFKNEDLPPPFVPEVLADLVVRTTKSKISLDDAVNGPTGHISLSGVKEWIDRQSKATLAHFNASAPK
ncbi:hypothetical protein DFQ28_000970 [Apophysomyces sp. BC1034]|nr:hypothetical protein DFQ30_008748 [Apophysomyces sp. BC1015]KAG0183306.1 hypothetical protein DFQ29_006875 [Apophysomyces sp. BC1021]KAG0194251.1 hypothetical protein DFQ28_000970 [Apophysomyces sp. BC1034]